MESLSRCFLLVLLVTDCGDGKIMAEKASLLTDLTMNIQTQFV